MKFVELSCMCETVTQYTIAGSNNHITWIELWILSNKCWMIDFAYFLWKNPNTNSSERQHNTWVVKHFHLILFFSSFWYWWDHHHIFIANHVWIWKPIKIWCASYALVSFDYENQEIKQREKQIDAVHCTVWNQSSFTTVGLDFVRSVFVVLRYKDVWGQMRPNKNEKPKRQYFPSESTIFTWILKYFFFHHILPFTFRICF